MRIEHVALWTRQLEPMRQFYETYFDAHAGTLYCHTHDSFASYFLTFSDGARLELMQLDNLTDRADTHAVGWAHLAVQVDSESTVDRLAQTLSAAGYLLAKQPARTGDGYYECAVYDPDGNIVEITA